VITTDKLGGGRCWLGWWGVPTAAEAKLEIHQPGTAETVARWSNVKESSNGAPDSSGLHIDTVSFSQTTGLCPASLRPFYVMHSVGRHLQFAWND
jgi:hypothetical protein